MADGKSRKDSADKSGKKKSLFQKFLFEITPNRSLFPLKCVIFFYGCSAFSILPYLTIHMKDIGISVENIAIIYAVLPFTSLISSPLVGFLADKLGSYTRVLMLTLLGDGVFYALLLAVPQVSITEVGSADDFTFQRNFLNSADCLNGGGNSTFSCSWNTDTAFDSLTFENCTARCPDEAHFSNLCLIFEGAMENCVDLGGSAFQLLNGTTKNKSENCTNQIFYQSQPLSVRNQCELVCQNKELRSCQAVEGNFLLTNFLYLVLRGIANMFLGCNFVLIDAQTITMCKLEKEQGGSGGLGRNFLFMSLSQVIISPTIGKLMDMTSKVSGQPNYLVPFMGNLLFILLTIVMVCRIQLNLELPKPTGLRSLIKIFKDIDITVFLLMTFILGNCWGFIETFLFVYLKDDMGAEMYLLGLTITVGAAVSIPFFFISDWIIANVGRVNVFIIALLMYAVRYIGYSFITNPWMSFPFELLELFTNNIMRVAAVQYIGVVAPEGMLATLNGLFGGIHYGLGKGTGSLIGGAIIAGTGSISTAFRCFGYSAAFFGGVYFTYWYGLRRFCKTETQQIEAKKKNSHIEENNQASSEEVAAFMEKLETSNV